MPTPLKPSERILQIAQELQRIKDQSFEIDDGAIIRAIMNYLDEEYERTKEEPTERVGFYEIFRDIDRGVENIREVQISGIRFGPNCKIGKGVTLGGIDFQTYKGRDLAVIKKENYWIIIGIY